jgi:hypothetical protein
MLDLVEVLIDEMYEYDPKTMFAIDEFISDIVKTYGK